MSQEPGSIHARKLEQAEKEKQEELQRELQRAKELARKSIPPKVWQRFMANPGLPAAAPPKDLGYLGLYHLSHNNLKDALKAFIIHKQAVEEEGTVLSASMHYYLGICYLFDVDLQKKAPLFFQQAFEKNFLLAGFPLALCYLYGLCVQKNPQRAGRFYEQLASHRNFEAAQRLVTLALQKYQEPVSVQDLVRDLGILHPPLNLTFEGINWKAYYYAAIYLKSQQFTVTTDENLLLGIEALLSQIKKTKTFEVGMEIYLAIIQISPPEMALLSTVKLYDALEYAAIYQGYDRQPSLIGRTQEGRIYPKDLSSIDFFKPFIVAYQYLLKLNTSTSSYPHLNIIYELIRENIERAFLQTHRQMSSHIAHPVEETRFKLKEISEIIFLMEGSDTLPLAQVVDMLYDIDQVGIISARVQEMVLAGHSDSILLQKEKTDQKKITLDRESTQSLKLSLKDAKETPAETKRLTAAVPYENPVSWSAVREQLSAEFSSPFYPELLHDQQFIGLQYRNVPALTRDLLPFAVSINPPVITLLLRFGWFYDFRNKFNESKSYKNREWQRAIEVIERELPLKYIEEFQRSCRLNPIAPLQEMYCLGLYYLEIGDTGKSFDTLVLYKNLAVKLKKPLSPGVFYYLGICCLHLDTWLQEAPKYFLQAIDQGHTLSMFSLAACYRNGWGVKRNLQAATRCYQLLAEQGNEEAIVEFLSLQLWKGQPPSVTPVVQEMFKLIGKACPGNEYWRTLYYTAVYYKSRPELFMGKGFLSIFPLILEHIKIKFKGLQHQHQRHAIYLQLSSLFSLSAVRAATKLHQELDAEKPSLSSPGPAIISEDYAYALRYAPLAICYARSLSMGGKTNSRLNEILRTVRENCIQTFLAAREAIVDPAISDKTTVREMLSECSKIIFLLGGSEALNIKDMLYKLYKSGQFESLSLSAQYAVLFGSGPLPVVGLDRESKASPSRTVQTSASGAFLPSFAGLTLAPAAPAVTALTRPRSRAASHPAASFIETSMRPDNGSRQVAKEDEAESLTRSKRSGSQ